MVTINRLFVNVGAAVWIHYSA